MSTADYGIKSHYMTESIERMTKWLKSVGWDDQDALRGAIQISLVLVDDYSRAEAREAADEIAAQHQREESSHAGGS